MGTETYEVSPAGGWADPLDDYFRGDIFGGFVGGGLGGWHSLDGSPFRLLVHLNEWVRFTKPGRYTLTVSSQRLERHSRQPTPHVRAAPVELVVVPGREAWAEQEVRRATSALARPRRDEATTSAAVLRHLGSKGAAVALLNHYRALDEQASFDLFAGLIASPYRALIVEEMEGQVDAGEPLPGSYIERLSYLRCLLELPRGTGDYPTKSARFAALRKEYEDRWAAARSKHTVTDPAARPIGSSSPPPRR